MDTFVRRSHSGFTASFLRQASKQTGMPPPYSHLPNRHIFSAIHRARPSSCRATLARAFASQRRPSQTISPISPLSKRFFSHHSLLRAGRPQWYAGRPVQTSRSTPLFQLQSWIDRKLPKKWLFYGIIAANGLIFAAWSYAEDVARRFRDFEPLMFMYKNFAASWSNILRPWTLITSCFSQRDLSHIFVNLFTFFFMAPSAFAILRTSQAAGLYLISGLVGNGVQLFFNLIQGDVGSSGSTPRFALGASGAISGFLSFVAMAFPTSTILLFAIVPCPAWAAVSGIVAYDIYTALKHPNGGVAAAAHVGGAAAGVLYFLRLRRGGRLGI